MRFLHTSDWHLGRSIKGHTLVEAQEIALNFIVEKAVEHRVGAVVIAGDIFDRSFPSVEDVRRLNRTLTRLHDAAIPIIMTAGNHDDGGRLAAYQNLLHENVHVVGEYHQVGEAFMLADEHGPVAFYPLPYLDPDGARRALAPGPDQLLERSHEAVMAEALRRIRIDLSERSERTPRIRSVVVAHAFVVNGSETSEDLRDEQSESERDISVGGVPSVPSGVFHGINYVALGHLHGPREIKASESTKLYYSGSILRYSLSELKQEKSVAIIDMDADGNTTITLETIPQPRGMAQLRGELKELCSEKFAQHSADFVEIELTDSRLPENFMAQLQQSFAYILNVRRDRQLPGTHIETGNSALPLVTPLETLCNFYRYSSGDEPSKSMIEILASALERAQKIVSK